MKTKDTVEEKIDTVKMLEDIDELVNTDFGEDMEGKAVLDHQKPFTQKEAKQMATLLANVYSISHGIHCTSCGRKYLK